MGVYFASFENLFDKKIVGDIFFFRTFFFYLLFFLFVIKN